MLPEFGALMQNGVGATPFGFGTPNPYNGFFASGGGMGGYMGPPLGSGGWPNFTSAGTGTTPAPWQESEFQTMIQDLANAPGPGPYNAGSPTSQVPNTVTGAQQF